ncbi:hypothetical protein AB0E75_24115 [Streptomyces griseoviridis]|jgi:hypothetical protein|uniref:Uncharacterized protein n=2 Tax=Streptomyces TaxID=1883 RepID=A0A918LEB7_STRGD|nr:MULTISPECIES: hypothetical protein [Streptomyces]GGS36926.1 hypothetical protein GCM10010238_27880 [Streptomyces niveoruber]GGU61059.1 hypothetical protein GCM10010259_59700 [Streptomyces daghestanicus]GHI32662.1 hypothetical protein Sdagh_43920 [Streptomyces daghestanicus]
MPGTVLLLAASPVGKGRLVDAASVLPVLAAVPPPVLSGTDTANVIELADPLDPQAVLTRLRAAAAAPGPLTVYVTGQLQTDRRQHLPHLALARTTPATVRYTALPWHWIKEELRLRPTGATTLLLDLHADQETWEWLRRNPLDCGRDNAVYGRVAPPPRRGPAVPTYMRGVATILRSGHRPPPGDLHQQALARSAAEDGGRSADLVLTVPGPAAGDPHAAVAAAVQAGRHADADALAAAHERDAVYAHGPASEDALHWTEVRADLAMFAGDPVRSCLGWLTVARSRLNAGQAADAPAVEAAVDRAHHQWGQIRDPRRARELGQVLAELRGRVPGRRAGALDHVRRQLDQLQTQG